MTHGITDLKGKKKELRNLTEKWKSESKLAFLQANPILTMLKQLHLP